MVLVFTFRSLVFALTWHYTEIVGIKNIKDIPKITYIYRVQLDYNYTIKSAELSNKRIRTFLFFYVHLPT